MDKINNNFNNIKINTFILHSIKSKAPANEGLSSRRLYYILFNLIIRRLITRRRRLYFSIFFYFFLFFPSEVLDGEDPTPLTNPIPKL